MKAYLSQEELDLVNNHNHVIVALDTDPSPQECRVLPYEMVVNGGYVECGRLEVQDKQGSYGAGMKYSLLRYFVASSDLGVELSENEIPRDDDGDLNFEDIKVIDWVNPPRYFKYN